MAKSKNNNMVYVIFGSIILIAIIAIVLFFALKKHDHSTKAPTKKPSASIRSASHMHPLYQQHQQPHNYYNH